MPYVVPRKATLVRSKYFGEIELGILSVGALEKISKVSADLPAREYCARVIHIVLLRPNFDVDEVIALPGGLLAVLARSWAKSAHGLRKILPSNTPVFQSFKQAMLEYIDEQVRRTAELLKGLNISVSNIMSPISASLSKEFLSNLNYLNSSALRGLNLSGFATQLAAPSGVLSNLKFGFTASSQISNLVKQFSASSLHLDSNMQLAAEAVRRVAQFNDIRLSATLQMSGYWAAQTQSHLKTISDLTLRASVLSKETERLFLSAANVSDKFGAYSAYLMKGMVRHPDDTSLMSNELITSAQTTAITLGTVKRIGERSLGGATTSEISIRESVKYSPQQLRSEIDARLSLLHPRFVAQWHGAWQALGSNNPDKLRQAAHSARELLNQILHELAPDNTFTPADLRENNREGKNPTRKMRIKKIFNKAGDSHSVLWVEAVTKMGDELYEYFSADAHSRDDIVESDVAGFLMCLDGILKLLLGHS